MDASSTPVLVRSTVSEADVIELAASARSLIEASRALSTRKAYESDFADFTDFCVQLNQPSLPASPEVVGLYIAELSLRRELATSTVTRRLSAISVTHAELGHDSPTAHPAVRRMLSGLRRTRAGNVTNERRALSVAELEVLLEPLKHDASETRDRALVLVGFIGGLRRSELVSIDIEHLTMTESGYSLRIPKSKSDQEGHGRTVILPYSANETLCPVRAINAWIHLTSIESGALFTRVRRGETVTAHRLTGQSVGLILKKRAENAGIESSRLGAHSLRSGFATAAAARGASERTIARQTGHKSTQVLRRYIHQANAFDDNAATELGL